jgi:hypothetical protein
VVFPKHSVGRSYLSFGYSITSLQGGLANHRTCSRRLLAHHPHPWEAQEHGRAGTPWLQGPAYCQAPVLAQSQNTVSHDCLVEVCVRCFSPLLFAVACLLLHPALLVFAGVPIARWFGGLRFTMGQPL